MAFVLLQHSLVGAIAPDEVYDHAEGRADPWTWALVHGVFILAESITCLLYWRVSEDALHRERQDLAELGRAHQDLAEAQALSGVGSWDWDIPSDSVVWSDQLYALAGLRKDAFVPSVDSFLDLVYPADRAEVAALIDAATEELTRLDCECRLLRADGAVRVIHALGECEVAADGTLMRMFGTVHDVTERNLLQQEIERLAFSDALTGLANRRLFLDRLEHALNGDDPSSRKVSVLFLDLGDFKSVNDTMGHGAGDELLREVARRLLQAVCPTDTVARLGGDELAILVQGVDLTPRWPSGCSRGFASPLACRAGNFSSAADRPSDYRVRRREESHP